MSSSRRRSIDLSKTNTSASMPIAMNAAFMPTTPPPMIITVAAATPGHAAEQDAAPAERLLEHERARLRGDLAGDLAHRREQRQAAVARPRRSRRRCRSRPTRTAPRVSSAVGGEVQVGEEHLPGPQQLDLLGLRLLDLQHHVGLAEHRRGVGHDARALRLVIVVGDRAALAGAGLDEHLVAALGQLAHAGGRERDAVLVGLDLGGDADLHRAPPLPVARPSRPRTRCRGARARGTGRRARRSARAAARRAPRSGPRASSRTAAAAGAPVETTPPPRPHRSHGRGDGAHPHRASRRRKPRRRAPRRCWRRAGAPPPRRPRSRSGGARASSRSALEQRRRQRQPEARLAGSRSCRRRCAARSAACRSCRRADRLAEVDRRRRRCSGSISTRLAVAQHDRRASSARRSASAARRDTTGRRGGSRSRPAAHHVDALGAAPSSRTARDAPSRSSCPGSSPCRAAPAGRRARTRRAARAAARHPVQAAEVDVVAAGLAGRPASRRG